jgi:UDP-N-acetylmuramate dehydrogenase
MLISDSGFDGLVVRMNTKGIVRSGNVLSVQAGEVWDDLVAYAVNADIYGFENLSAIPGSVGAAPVQNIGAYGVEICNLIQSVRAFDTIDMSFIELSNAACAFGYRDSIFKHHKGRYIITRVDFTATYTSRVYLEYKDLKEYFKQDIESGHVLTPLQVREAVIAIRTAKLPDWKHWGTAGSFFKNPIVSQHVYDALKTKYPDMPFFPESDGMVKIPLGWILDKVCNMKGLKHGRVRVYEKQALVLVSEFGATAQEVKDLARILIDCVKEKTGIDIEGEVEWVN